MVSAVIGVGVRHALPDPGMHWAASIVAVVLTASLTEVRAARHGAPRWIASVWQLAAAAGLTCAQCLIVPYAIFFYSRAGVFRLNQPGRLWVNACD